MMRAGERGELGKLVRLRAKVAKSDVLALAARHLADVEAQLAAKYSTNHAAWAHITAEAEKFVEEADAKIAERCRELGILPEFRPHMEVYWHGRGENADRQRRAELRRVAESEIESRVKTAQAEIDRCAANQLTQLASGALTSDEARAFLESMPSVDALLPAIMLPELEVKNPARLTP